MSASTASSSAVSALLHRCSRLSATACVFSVLAPFLLFACYMGENQPGAILLALLSAVPAAGAAVLFLTAATAYSLARDSGRIVRFMLATLALGCSVAGLLPWLWFSALGSV